MQFGFHLVAESRCLFHAQAGTGANMQSQKASIHLRKEVLPNSEEPKRKQTEDQEANDENTAIFNCRFQQRLVAPPEFFKIVLKSTLEAAKDCLGPGGAVLVAAHDVHDQGGPEFATISNWPAWRS